MEAPLISVLLPVRDGAPALEAAAHSILRQTYARLELWLIDDGSRDGTAGVCARIAGEDARVRTLRTEGVGLPRALELGRARCRGELIARMDADDQSLPDRLERSVAALQGDPSLWAVGTQVEIFREDRPVSPNMQAYARWLNGLASPEQLARERFIDAPLCHPSATLRAAALERVGGWEDGPFAEDYQLWLKMIRAGGRLAVVPEVLFRWRDSDARLTRTDPRYGGERLVELKAVFLAGLVGAGERALVWGATRVGLHLLRGLAGRGVAVAALVEVDPRKIGQRIDGVPVIAAGVLPGPGGLRLFAAVGAKGAREEIRAFAAARGWKEGEDFFCVA